MVRKETGLALTLGAFPEAEVLPLTPPLTLTLTLTLALTLTHEEEASPQHPGYLPSHEG